MGDRTSVKIEVGGDLTEDKLEALCAVIEAERFDLDYGGGDPVTPTMLRALIGPLILTANEVNYANADDLESALRDAGLRYRKTWDSGGGFPAGGEVVTPEGATEFTCGGIEGEAGLSAATIRALGSWEAVIAELDRLTGPWPALRVVPAPPQTIGGLEVTFARDGDTWKWKAREPCAMWSPPFDRWIDAEEDARNHLESASGWEA